MKKDTLVLQYDDRDVTQFQKLIDTNILYCKKFNYDHLLLTKGYEEYPPYWRKVFLVIEYLYKYNIVLWIDTDAAIVSNEKINIIFKPKTHFAFSSNPSLLHLSCLDMLAAPMCAGVWAVKSTPEGKTIMDYWSQAYDATKWFKENEKWKTLGVYGGANYEQGSFELHIFRKPEFEKWLSHWDHHVLNFMPPDDHLVRGQNTPKDVFAVHYWTGNRKHIKKHFN